MESLNQLHEDGSETFIVEQAVGILVKLGVLSYKAGLLTIVATEETISWHEVRDLFYHIQGASLAASRTFKNDN